MFLPSAISQHHIHDFIRFASVISADLCPYPQAPLPRSLLSTAFTEACSSNARRHIGLATIAWLSSGDKAANCRSHSAAKARMTTKELLERSPRAIRESKRLCRETRRLIQSNKFVAGKAKSARQHPADSAQGKLKAAALWPATLGSRRNHRADG